MAGETLRVSSRRDKYRVPVATGVGAGSYSRSLGNVTGRMRHAPVHGGANGRVLPFGYNLSPFGHMLADGDT